MSVTLNKVSAKLLEGRNPMARGMRIRFKEPSNDVVSRAMGLCRLCWIKEVKYYFDEENEHYIEMELHEDFITQAPENAVKWITDLLAPGAIINGMSV